MHSSTLHNLHPSTFSSPSLPQPIPQPSSPTPNRMTSNPGNMTPRQLSSKLSSSKPTQTHTRSAPLGADQIELEKDSSPNDVSGPAHLHSSAAAPRQSEAFKRLGKASLVSSSIFKSAPSTPKQPTSFAINNVRPSTTSQLTPGSRTSFTPQRTPGSQSQMAAALKGLGIAAHVLSPADTSRPPTHTRPLLNSTQGTKRKSDENLPVPPRPPPNLPPSSPPSHGAGHHSSNQKARPPRQSLAFNALTRNALVTSSPFKSSGSPTPFNKLVSSSSDNLRLRTTPSRSARLIPSSSEGDEASSHDSDVAPGTPSSEDARPAFIPRSTSPRPTGTTNGVLKIQRLGGPRSFTPPHSPQARCYASESETSNLVRRAPSALSCTGRRRERRKTVTWGGEDVLEFEWEEEWRRTSTSSTIDSVSSAQESKSEDISDSNSDLDIDHRPHLPEDHQANTDHDSQPEDSWKSSLSGAPSNGIPCHDHRNMTYNSLQDEEEMLDQSNGSIIVHQELESGSLVAGQDELDDSLQLSISSNGPPCAPNSFSSELDPVEQMVNELLTSPDLAGHVTAHSLQPWTSAATEIDPTSVSNQDDTIDGEISDAVTQPVDLPGPDGDKKRVSRFPFITPNPPPEQSQTTPTLDNPTELMDVPVKNSPSVQTIPFEPISLPTLGLDETPFDEASMISSILESSTLEVQSLDTIPSASLQPMRSSTPRTSFSDQMPDPNPTSPHVGLASSAIQVEVEDTLATTAAHTSPRRPLPRPPPTSPSPQLKQDALPTFPTFTASAHNLPDIPHSSPFPSSNPLSHSGTGWVRPTSASISESETGWESGVSSPAGTRPRITRKKIQDRMRDRDGIASPGDESVEVVASSLPRGLISHSASIHKLGLNGEEEKLDLAPEMSLDSDTPSTVTIGPAKEIQARPPMRALQVTLAESAADDHVIEETVFESQEMGSISSGLDKLARGFQALDDGKSSDSSVSVIRPDLVDPVQASPGEAIRLPSKMIMIKGVGRRRRSLSTGGADLMETGTGSGAKAAVKSTPLKRHSMAVDSQSSKITSGLLFNTIQPAMDRTSLQEPLNQVLKKANKLRSYNVYESDEVVIASDHTVTAGVAGDVAANQNWRKVRKVSDINQHAAQLKEFWAKNENVNKIGRVFVKISKLVFRGVPLSQPPAQFQVIIDNGLHKVKTPFYSLAPEVNIGVEFELVRANKLEFKLAFSVPLNEPQNAHLKPTVPPQPLPPQLVSPPLPATVATSPKRLFGFLGASSKRSSKHQQQLLQEKERQLQREKASLTRQLAAQRTSHPLVGLLNRNHILANAVVNFEQYARESLGTWKVAAVPCMSALEDPVKAEMQMRRTFTGPIGQVSLEFLLLPPIPKLPNTTFPNSGSECLKGLQIAEWWQQVWHEGVLSQLGADCSTWKRRTIKATGGSLFAYNDIMKKISAEIRLTEVVSLQDCGNGGVDENEQPRRGSISDQGEILPPFTFRLLFKDGSEILFHADNQTDFKRWKNVLKPLIGKIQPLPAWAELLRLQIAAKRAALVDETLEDSKTLDSDEEDDRHVKAAGSRMPGRQSRMSKNPPKSSSQGSTTSTITSGRSSNYPPTMSTLLSDSCSSHPPGSPYIDAASHRTRLSPIPSHPSSRLPAPSLAASDTSSYPPTRSLLSTSVSTASSMLSSQTLSTSTSTAPSSKLPVKSQMKRAKPPMKFH